MECNMPYTNTLKNRAYNRHYMASVYASRKADGLCTQCGRPATEGVRCSGCAEKARVQARARMRKRRPAWRKLGICTVCGCREAIPGQCWCGVCSEQQLEHKRVKAA